MVVNESVPETARKKQISKVAVIFFTGILLLTFFSNTLNHFMLPKVTVETPAAGALIRQVKGTGVVKAKKYASFYAPAGIEILEVLVNPGSPVKKGQPIVKLDVSQLKSQLEDEKARLLQKKLILEGLQDKNSQLSYDQAVEDAKLDRDNAEKAYEKANKKLHTAQELFTSGAEPKNTVDTAQAEADVAKQAWDKAEIGYSFAKAGKTKAAADGSKSMESTRADIAIVERAIAALEKKVGMETVTAQSDGIVAVLNAVEGELTDSSKPLYRIAQSALGFRFVFAAEAKSAELLKTGDTGEITIPALGAQPVQGTVAAVADDPEGKGDQKTVSLDIPSDGLTGDETGYATILKNSGSYDILVSNAAIGQDSRGNFVYILKNRKGPLGNEYSVRRVSVTIADHDDSKTAVTGGITGSDIVVAGSDKALSDGVRVLPDQEEAE